MNSPDQAPLIDYFSEIPDPRIDHGKLHNLQEILIISICTVICGAEEWTAIETFAQSKEPWFRSFLKLQNGIPSHDTFGRVFASLDPIAFENCFLEWIRDICQ